MTLSTSPNQAHICAVLATAGVGARFNSKSPKQFIDLADKPLYQWSLLRLAKHKDIEHIVIVTLPEMVNIIKDQINTLRNKYDLSAEISVTPGGATRQESVLNGLLVLSKLSQKPDFVLIHDAARPFLTQSMINDTIYAVKQYGACTVCLQASDTIKRTTGNFIKETLDREELVHVQTPQASNFNWLLEAHQRARTNNFTVTDDSALLEKEGHQVAIVKAPQFNLKVTCPEDLILAQALSHLLIDEAQNLITLKY